MTASEAAEHWRKGSQRALKAAKNSLVSRDFEMALFSCHLAVEKQLKALYIVQKNKEPPKTHHLIELCSLLQITLSEEELIDNRELMNFAMFGRYGSEEWVEAEATVENVKHWIERTEYLLTKFSS